MLKIKKSLISPCGIDCSKCGFLGTDCKGCRVLEGKPFHTQGKTCILYSCSIKLKRLNNCGECAELPCKMFNVLRDPALSDEEFDRQKKERIERLNNLETEEIETKEKENKPKQVTTPHTYTGRGSDS